MLKQIQSNLSSRYEILLHEEDPYLYTFTTEKNVLYSCRFGKVPNLSPLLGIYDLEVRDFLFYPSYPKPDFKKYNDSRVFPTIIGMVEDYLNMQDHVLLYVCDATDKKEKARQKLFAKWHESIADTILLRDLELEVSDDQTLECGVMVHKECQHYDIIQTELIEKAYSVILPKYGR